MLRDVFPELLDGRAIPASSDVWESSRFALDVPANAPKGRGGIAKATYELFAGMVEFGLSRQLTAIVTVTDVRVERLLRRANWPLQRLGSPREVGTTKAVAGLLDVSGESLARLRIGGSLKGPVLWTPVDLRIA